MRKGWTVLLLTAALLGIFALNVPVTAFASPSNLPDTPTAIPLEIDDGHYEGMLGLYNHDGTGKQFLWLNRFTPDTTSFPFTLQEISVLFDQLGGSNKIKVGDAIELVVYRDNDSSPQNGANLLGHYHEEIQAVDGQTWSRYRLDPPIELAEPGDVLIGVVNRYTVDSVSPKSYPAMYDTTENRNRSWYGWWPSGVSEPPDLASAAIIKQQAGNWLLRAYGSQESVTTSEAPPAPVPVAPPNPAPAPNPSPRVRLYIPMANNR